MGQGARVRRRRRFLDPDRGRPDRRVARRSPKRSRDGLREHGTARAVRHQRHAHAHGAFARGRPALHLQRASLRGRAADRRQLHVDPYQPARTRRPRRAGRPPAVAGLLVTGARRLRGKPPRAEGRQMDRLRDHARRGGRSRPSDARRARPRMVRCERCWSITPATRRRSKAATTSAWRLARRRQGADPAAASGRRRPGVDRHRRGLQPEPSRRRAARRRAKRRGSCR